MHLHIEGVYVPACIHMVVCVRCVSECVHASDCVCARQHACVKVRLDISE